MKELDFSAVINIDLPKIPRANEYEDRKPDEYWEIYKKGYSFYNRRWYEKAKNEFLKLFKFENPHRKLESLLLPVYRKFLERLIKKGKLKKTYELFNEFFDICKDEISNRDRTKYNKLIGRLLKKFPNSDYKKVKLAENEIKQEFEVTNFKNINLRLLSEEKTDREEFSKIWRWSFIENINKGTIYIKRLYNKELSSFDKSYIVLINSVGNTEGEYTINHGIYNIKAAENSNKFIASSDDLKLYLYDAEGRCFGTYNLRFQVEDKGHVRCVDISPEGKFILYTHTNRLYLMDLSFKEIFSWKTPNTKVSNSELIEEGWQKDSNFPEKYRECLSLLELSERPTTQEIKKAFRNKIRIHHPDLNPDDPKAKETTIAIIDAYEKLTGEDAKKAFLGDENADYYYKIISEIEIPGEIEPTKYKICLGLSFGHGRNNRDWIYTTHLSPNAERIYVGCYSGKVYCILKNGIVIKQYNCHDGVEKIKEIGKYVFLKTWYGIYIIKDDNYLTYVKMGKSEDLRWIDNGFMLVGEKHLRVLSNEGFELCRINFFKNKIYYFRWIEGKLKLITARKTYIFSIGAI